MEVVKKLRECAQNPSAGWIRNLENTFGLHRDRCGGVSYKPDGEEILNAIADEIEREIEEKYAQIPTTDTGIPRMCAADAEAMLQAIANEDWEFFDGVRERYMLLPVDADGVLIRIGDTVREVDDYVPMKVMSLTFYEDCVDVNTCGMNPNLLRHVKLDPVKELLKEFAENGIRIGASEPIPANLHMYPDEEVIDEFVERIRQAVES